MHSELELIEVEIHKVESLTLFENLISWVGFRLHYRIFFSQDLVYIC